jgi:hypothetical protein
MAKANEDTKTETVELVDAFTVTNKGTPIIIPGIEGRITQEMGPFVLMDTVDPTGKPARSRFFLALVKMVEQRILTLVKVPKGDVLYVTEGGCLPKAQEKSLDPSKTLGIAVSG